jgi:hypothetical protein
MAFFDIPKDEDFSPEASHWFGELRRLRGVESLAPSWRAYARSPQILEARVKAEANLFRQRMPSGFSWEARLVAFMLVPTRGGAMAVSGRHAGT